LSTEVFHKFESNPAQSAVTSITHGLCQHMHSITTGNPTLAGPFGENSFALRWEYAHTYKVYSVHSLSPCRPLHALYVFAPYLISCENFALTDPHHIYSRFLQTNHFLNHNLNGVYIDRIYGLIGPTTFVGLVPWHSCGISGNPFG
jgi:hypothetical protein